MGLLCKILGHKHTRWSVEFKNSLIIKKAWVCERCGHELVVLE